MQSYTTSITPRFNVVRTKYEIKAMDPTPGDKFDKLFTTRH